MRRVKATERVTKTLIFKNSICGDYYNGKLHDYIYMEDEEGNEYIYSAAVGSSTGGELILSRFNTKFTMSFSPFPSEDGEKTIMFRPRIIKRHGKQEK
jgi:hypothetical protein